MKILQQYTISTNNDCTSQIIKMDNIIYFTTTVNYSLCNLYIVTITTIIPIQYTTYYYNILLLHQLNNYKLYFINNNTTDTCIYLFIITIQYIYNHNNISILYI